jgi:DNA modification methylase
MNSKEIKIKCKGNRTLPLQKLQNFQGNLKELREPEYQKLKKSILKHGFCFPVMVWQNNIIDGHQRIFCLKKLLEEGYNIEALPVVDIEAKNEKDAKHKLLLFNSHYGKITDDGLYEFTESAGLKLDDWKDEIEYSDIDMDYFQDNYYNDLNLNTENDDEIPDDVVPITKKGDLYELGKHRVLCGDSTKIEDVERLMDGQKVDMVFTSPPYNSGNVNFKYEYKSNDRGSFYREKTDKKTKQEYFDFLIKVLQNIKEIISKKHSIFWNVSYNSNSRDDYGKIIFSNQNPFSVKETIIWDKLTGFATANKNILSRWCELIFLMSNSDEYLTNQRHHKDIYWNRWGISSQNSQDVKNKHRACYPIKLPGKAIIDFSKTGMFIYDCFLGTGSTLIAAEKTNRICYGMEIDEHYCDVIVERYKQFCLKNKTKPIIKRNGVELKNIEVA